MSKELTTKILQMTSDFIGVEVDELNKRELVLTEDLGLDIWELTELCINMEDLLDIVIYDEDIFNLTTIGNFVDLIIREVKKS